MTTMRLFIAANLLLLATTVQGAIPHPFHTSHAEIEFNAKTKTLEVALKLFPGDLERALERMTRSKIRLEKTPGIDRKILDYVNATLRIKRGKSDWQKARWVGKEPGVKTVWVYVEIPCTKGFDGLTVQNRVFQELQSNQINTVDFTQGKLRQTLSFRKNKSQRILKLSEFKQRSQKKTKTSSPASAAR